MKMLTFRTAAVLVPLVLLPIVLLLWAELSMAAAPAVGDDAPAFRLQDQNGDWHALEDYRGDWLILYFYPRDFTPGCTTEACAFRDDIMKFRSMGVRIAGVSVDDVSSHEKFAEEYSLPFPLLADAGGDVSKTYDTFATTTSGVGIATRQTFIIDPDGKIVRHYAKVDADTHSQQLQTDLDDLIGDDQS